MDRETRAIVVVPLLVWAGLLLLLLLSLGYAYLPGAPVKLAFGLLVAGAKVALIGLIFMQLRAASGLVRLAAAVGLAWLSLLFLFSFADFVTR